MNIAIAVVAVIVGLLIGGAAAYAYVRSKLPSAPVTTGADVDRLLAEAQAQTKEMVLAAKEEAHSIRTAAENDARERRNQVQRLEQRMVQKEENLDRRLEGLEKRERQLTQREEEGEGR